MPVDSVSWCDCEKILRTLYLKYRDALPSGFRYALPTETQWEYACRAGTTTPFSFGSVLNGDQANCKGILPYGTDATGVSKEKTTLVKSNEPNAWGLYDMHGNVWEWTSDWYDENGLKVLRGGSWGSYSRSCRSARRYCRQPDSPSAVVGFRLILVPHPLQSKEFISPREYPNGDALEVTREAGALKTLKIAGVKVNFHWAPAGTFMMGSPETEMVMSYGTMLHLSEETQHEVTLTQGFWIAETPTPQELWQAVMGNNPSHFIYDSRQPVDSVSWNDCQDFVEKLNRNYHASLPNGYKYAMPTEAQWEYACRAGTTTPFSFGSTLNGDNANCFGRRPYGTSTKGEYKEEPTPVGSYQANAWGLYDMHGNVCEWCADWYDWDYYASSSAMEDPTGPDSGSSRVLRGGSWGYFAWSCRSANRFNNAAGRATGTATTASGWS